MTKQRLILYHALALCFICVAVFFGIKACKNAQFKKELTLLYDRQHSEMMAMLDKHEKESKDALDNGNYNLISHRLDSERITMELKHQNELISLRLKHNK